MLQATISAPSDSLQQEARLLYITELHHNYDKASQYLFEGIEQAKEAHDFYFLGQFYNTAGVMYTYSGNNVSALIYFQTSLNYRTYLKDTAGMAASSLGMSNVYRIMGDYEVAIRYGLDAEKTSLQINDPDMLARIYNSLGLILSKRKIMRKHWSITINVWGRYF